MQTQLVAAVLPDPGELPARVLVHVVCLEAFFRLDEFGGHVQVRRRSREGPRRSAENLNAEVDCMGHSSCQGIALFAEWVIGGGKRRD